MRINADFKAPVSVTPAEHRWVASPQPGVERVVLDRIGGEIARATSLVRYAKNSNFPPHKHPGGEEILVLSGTFSDEHGDYPAGWYLRNPPGSAHRPHSQFGTLIFVKLFQMSPYEVETIRVDSGDASNWQVTNGRNICTLFDNGEEHVFMERLPHRGQLAVSATGGLEVLILSGELSVDGKSYPQGSWFRQPAGSYPTIHALGACMVFVKTGHLRAIGHLEALQ